MFHDGRIVLEKDPSRVVSIADAMRAGKLDRIEAEETAAPDKRDEKNWGSYTHSAVFVEVRVDEELGVVRVTRMVDAVAAGRIINPKTARSQVIGGVVFGIGMALHEEGMTDHKLGRFMNHNFAEYHVPANADIPDIEVIFVDEHDEQDEPARREGARRDRHRRHRRSDRQRDLPRDRQAHPRPADHHRQSISRLTPLFPLPTATGRGPYFSRAIRPADDL